MTPNKFIPNKLFQSREFLFSEFEIQLGVLRIAGGRFEEKNEVRDRLNRFIHFP